MSIPNLGSLPQQPGPPLNPYMFPDEMVLQIAEGLGEPDESKYGYNSEACGQNLCNFMLVCKQFRRCGEEVLYRKCALTKDRFRKWENRPLLPRLFLFARTLFERPDLADRAVALSLWRDGGDVMTLDQCFLTGDLFDVSKHISDRPHLLLAKLYRGDDYMNWVSRGLELCQSTPWVALILMLVKNL